MGYKIVNARKARDYYADSDVPGEFRRLTDELGAKQLAATLIHIPPHSDFEQGTGHYHDQVEEIYIISRGTLTMRLGDDIVKVPAGSVVCVEPKTPRSHRNEGDEPVDMWAISPKIDRNDATLLKVFWAASPQAVQKRQPGRTKK